jgi:hypothetical protein
VNHSLVLVLAVSLVIGLAMVVVIRYTTDQKAIRRAKDRLKAHMLEVRLFQDQLPVVLRAYVRILWGTVRYLQLSGKSLALVIIPLVLLVAQLDRSLGYLPLRPQQPFLVKARGIAPGAFGEVRLQLPGGVTESAPAVHMEDEHEIVWRLTAEQWGTYDLNLVAGGQSLLKQVVVAEGLARVSPTRFRDHFWERWLTSGEAALPEGSPAESIEVLYPPRNIPLGSWELNWIVLFFVASMVAGFFFKTILRIEI